MDLYEAFKGLFYVLIAIAVVLIVLYILLCIFLDKFHKLVYGTGTWMAGCPVIQWYIMGKLALNNIYGWIFSIIMCLGFITINDKPLVPHLRLISLVVYFITLIGLIVKYNKVKKEKLPAINTIPTENVKPLANVNTKICPKCNSNVSSDSIFCTNCGERFE